VVLAGQEVGSVSADAEPTFLSPLLTHHLTKQVEGLCSAFPIVVDLVEIRVK
jgi:hypothetical protein